MSQCVRYPSRHSSSQNENTNNRIIFEIEKIVKNILEDVAAERSPNLVIDKKTTWSNVVFNTQKGLQPADTQEQRVLEFMPTNDSGITKWSMMLYMLSKIHYLLLTDTKSTVRQIYYENVQLFKQQATVSKLIDDISTLIKVNRRELNVFATAKGLVMGNLMFRRGDDDITDCSATPILMPNDIYEITEIRSQAKHVFIVEKDATFQKLVNDNFLATFKEPSILITGKGFPDICTREMVSRLKDELKKSVNFYAICDADPWGIEIVSIYAFGSLARAQEDLAVPTIRWLGIHPTDITRLQLKEKNGIPLKEIDKERIKHLLTRPYIIAKPDWKKQLEFMQEIGCKLEIQGLQEIDEAFLSNVYLPAKIRHQGWL